jgi:hypothetical protein
MQKSTEERLTAIETSITRLTKMQGCVFNMLVFLRKASVLGERFEQTVALVKASGETYRWREGHGMVLLFGGVAMASLAISIHVLFPTAQDSGLRVSTLVFFSLAAAFMLFSLREFYEALRQDRVTKKYLNQMEEDLACIRENGPAINDTLSRVLAEWKELVPDDSVSEPKSKD